MVRSFTWPALKSMWMWKLLWAPAWVSAGAAARPLSDSACADAGNAQSAATAINSPTTRLGVRFMPLRSFPLWLLARKAPAGPRCPKASIGRSLLFGRRFDRVWPLQRPWDLPHANHLGRDAADDRVGRDVARDHRVGAHDGVVADPDPAQEAGAVPDPDVRADHALAHVDALLPDRPLDLDDAVIEVDEHRPIGDHALLSDPHALVRGDRAVLTEDGLCPDLDDALVAADLRPI